MSDEERTTGVQLAERVSNKNPLVSEEVPAVISPGDIDYGDTKPLAVEKPPPPDDIDVNEEELRDSEPVNNSTTIVESSTAGAPSAGNSEHITECATAWSVVGFALTTAHTGIHAAFALTKDDAYGDFYVWVTKPICVTAMAVSFMLKPRRRDFAYMTFLYFQYATLTLGSEVSELDDQSISSYLPQL